MGIRRGGRPAPEAIPPNGEGGRHGLLVSAAVHSRLAVAAGWVRARLVAGEVLLVAPTHGAGLDFVHRLAASGPVLGLRRSTLGELAAELALPRLAADGWTVATRLAERGLAERALFAAPAEALGELAALRDAPHLPSVLARSLAELRAWTVAPSALHRTVGRRAGTLAALLAGRDAIAVEHRLADRADVLATAVRAVGEGTHPLRGLPLLLLDLAPRDPLEGALLAALAAAAPAVLATLDEGDEEGREALERVLGCSAEPAAGAAAGPPARRRLERAQHDLFRPRPAADVDGGGAPRPATADADESVAGAGDESLSVLTAPNEGREAVELVRRVLAFAERGVPFDRMAILLRDPQLYQAPIEEALGRAGVPAWISRGSLRPDPAGRAFLTLLTCAAEGLSASRFAEYLGFGQLPAGDLPPEPDPERWEPPRVEEGAAPRPPAAGEQLELFAVLPPAPAVEPGAEAAIVKAAAEVPPPAPRDAIAGTLPAPRRWERLLVDAAVVGGHDRWARRLAGLRAELELQRRDAEDAVARDRLDDQLARLAALSAFALPVIEDLARLPASGPWSAWLPPLAALAQRTLARPERVLAVLSELAVLGDVGPVELGDVIRVLREELTDLRDEPPAGRAGRVLVATPAEAAGRSFAVVLVPGLAEGLFPRPPREDPLLLDAERELLGGADGGWPGLPTQRRRAARERQLLRLAVGAAEQALVVSWAGHDAATGRARVPSFYALDLLRAADGRLPGLAALAALDAGSGGALGAVAPRDPTRAIDDAEYDLAVLAGALASPTAATGRARYLMEVHPRLGATLRARFARWGQQRFGPADGLVAETGEARFLLASHRLAARAYSPTALEGFAACPYRFYLHGVLGLRERDQAAPLVQLDPLTRGSLFHEVQFRLLAALRDADALPVRSANLDAASARLDAVLDSVAGLYRERLAPAIPRVWEGEIESLRIDLRGWLRRAVEEVVAAGEEAFVPRHFELAFGLVAGSAAARGEHDPASRREEVTVVRGARLRGSIDMVEEDAAGRLRVTDHKTGLPPAERALRVGRGERLQPILYALAAERLFDRPVAGGRLSFCTRRGRFTTLDVPLDELSRLAITDVLDTIDAAVEHAFLPAAPRDRACRYCAYRPICGPHEERRVTLVKDASRLQALDAIRERD